METGSSIGLCGGRLAEGFRDEGATDEEFSGTQIEISTCEAIVNRQKHRMRLLSLYEGFECSFAEFLLI